MHPLWLTFNSGCLERGFLLEKAQRGALSLPLYLCLAGGIVAAEQYRLARGSERLFALRHLAFCVALCLLIAIWAGLAVDFIKRGSVELRNRAVLSVKLLYLSALATYTHQVWTGVEKDMRCSVKVSQAQRLDVASAVLLANFGEGFMSVLLSFIGLPVLFKTQFFTTIIGVPWNFWNSRTLVLHFEAWQQEKKDIWWPILEESNRIFQQEMFLSTRKQSVPERRLCQMCILLVGFFTAATCCLSISWLLEVIEREKYLMWKLANSSPAEAVEVKKESFLLQSGYTIENVTEGLWLSTVTVLCVGYCIIVCGESALLLPYFIGLF